MYAISIDHKPSKFWLFLNDSLYLVSVYNQY